MEIPRKELPSCVLSGLFCSAHPVSVSLQIHSICCPTFAGRDTDMGGRRMSGFPRIHPSFRFAPRWLKNDLIFFLGPCQSVTSASLSCQAHFTRSQDLIVLGACLLDVPCTIKKFKEGLLQSFWLLFQYFFEKKVGCMVKGLVELKPGLS